jgi:hypothetical protein
MQTPPHIIQECIAELRALAKKVDDEAFEAHSALTAARNCIASAITHLGMHPALTNPPNANPAQSPQPDQASPAKADASADAAKTPPQV